MPAKSNLNSKKQFLEIFEVESGAILDLGNRLPHNLDEIIASIIDCKGKVILCGIGKSGHIAKKISATLASTGTPSFYLHPAEGLHGDLGMVENNDVIILISYSGETNEILQLIPFFRANQNVIISFTGAVDSTMAKNSNYVFDISVEKEACPLDLAPTTSTTATLVMGDALAVTLMNSRNFQEENFARFHPGGSLGRKLLTKAQDIMKVDQLPKVTPKAKGDEVITSISSGKIGLTVVMENNKINGIITDGDLRRAINQYKSGFFDVSAEQICTKNPITVLPQTRLTEIEQIMTENKIGAVLVAVEHELKGVVQIYNI